MHWFGSTSSTSQRSAIEKLADKELTGEEYRAAGQIASDQHQPAWCGYGVGIACGDQNAQRLLCLPNLPFKFVRWHLSFHVQLLIAELLLIMSEDIFITHWCICLLACAWSFTRAVDMIGCCILEHVLKTYGRVPTSWENLNEWVIWRCFYLHKRSRINWMN